MRGPRKGYRVFDGTTFALGSIHQNQNRAKQSADRIRKMGVNARVISGKGWSAVYVSFPAMRPGGPPMAQERERARRSKAPTPRAPTRRRRRRRKKPNRKTTVQWDPEKQRKILERRRELGKEDNTEYKTKLMKGMSVLLWKEDDYFRSKGLGRIFPAFEIQDNATVTDFEIINLQSEEGREFLNGITMKQGDASFKSWMKAAGKAREMKWNPKNKSPLLEPLNDALVNGNPQDINIFVISIDERPAYWSPLDGDYAMEITGSSPSNFKGWDRYERSMGR